MSSAVKQLATVVDQHEAKFRIILEAVVQDIPTHETEQNKTCAPIVLVVQVVISMVQEQPRLSLHEALDG